VGLNEFMGEEELEPQRHRANGRPVDGKDINQIWDELRRHYKDEYAHPSMRRRMIAELHLETLWDERNTLKAWIAVFAVVGAVIGGLIGAVLPVVVNHLWR
jgi:hypothetical protein